MYLRKGEVVERNRGLIEERKILPREVSYYYHPRNQDIEFTMMLHKS